MENKDIRWIQRFNNFTKSLNILAIALEIPNPDIIQKAGIIQFFEMTYELAWLTMKDYYEEQGEPRIQGSKDVIKLAFRKGLIHQGEDWFKMVDSRKLSVHAYDKKTAEDIAEDIANTYFSLFIQLQNRLQIEKLKI